MFNDLHKLELTARDISLIEAALHTQKKILSVQSEAGGAGAREKLSDLTQVIRRVGRANSKITPRRARGWLTGLRTIFAPRETCGQVR